MAPYRRLVRRRPISERIRSYFDIWDFLLWLSEEFEGGDWDQWQRDWATPIGIGLNLGMLIARSNSARSTNSHDDVFGDGTDGRGLLNWLVRSALRVCLDAKAANENLLTGNAHRSLTLFPLFRQRLVYLLPKAALPAV